MKKFKKQDVFYITERSKFAKRIGKQEVFDVADHFGLYSGTQTIGRALFIYEILKKAIEIPGDIVEFGCWKGNNLLFMSKVLSLLQPNSLKQVYAFDSFEGLQTFSDEDGGETKKIYQNEYKGNEKLLRDCIKLYEMEDWVSIIAGDAMETIDKFEKDNPHVMFSLAYIDFDLYEPCVKSLQFIHRNLCVGGYVILDEALTDEWKGEGQALKEFLAERESQYQMIANVLSRQPTVTLKRIK